MDCHIGKAQAANKSVDVRACKTCGRDMIAKYKKGKRPEICGYCRAGQTNKETAIAKAALEEAMA